MKQGTTYPIIISVPGIDLSGADWVIVSIKARMKPAIEFERDEMLVVYADDVTTVTVHLSQAQSLALSEGSVTVDLNWEMDGIRGGCIPESIVMTGTLLKREVGV